MKTKLCKGCDTVKDTQEFRNRLRPSGYISIETKCKQCESVYSAQWTKAQRALNPEMRRIYDASEQGKKAKRKHEEAYKVSGGRTEAEKRRAEKPISEARKRSKQASNIMRRERHKDLILAKDELSLFALKQAYELRDMRIKLCKGDWNVDHIIPVAKGGTSAWDNIQVVPALWNKQKSHYRIEKYFGGN